MTALGQWHKVSVSERQITKRFNVSKNLRINPTVIALLGIWRRAHAVVSLEPIALLCEAHTRQGKGVRVP